MKTNFFSFSPVRVARCFLPFVLLFIAGSGRGQTDGWALLEQNLFVEARPAFEAQLTQNPNDEQALTGLIFLAETVQDYAAYHQYTNRLLRLKSAPHYVWLFGHMYEGDPGAMLQQPLAESLLIPFYLQQADTLFKYRRFAESVALRRCILPDWQWLITGPFTNVAGSGHAETTLAETRPFDRHAGFRNEEGDEFGWLPLLDQAPGAPVSFLDLPASSGEHGLYYAQTFLQNPVERRVALRITRSAPIKIWLDDQLLFENPQPADQMNWDVETVAFLLPAGEHRLLIKVAEFPYEGSTSEVQLDYNDRTNDGEEKHLEMSFDDYWGAEPARVEQPYFSDLYRSAVYPRFTDPATGALIPDLTARNAGTYAPARESWKTEVTRHPWLTYFLEQARQDERALWRRYLLAKAFLKYAEKEAGEAHFAALQRQHPESAFYKFLLAKFYDANDKGERAEALLSELDTANSPCFAEQYIRLQKINVDQDEPSYIAALERLLALSPANWGILHRYLEFLKEKGRDEQIKTVVQNFTAKYPDEKWKKRLEPYLKDKSYKPKTASQPTDKEREKDFKAARKRLKKTFSRNDYDTLLEYYNHREQTSAVLATYDEILAILPWQQRYRLDKINYLFEHDRAADALPLVLPLLEKYPHNPELAEIAGDIYLETKDEANALKCYKQADRTGGRTVQLLEKIERLENRKAYTGYFAPADLLEKAADRSWQQQYADEDAVITFFNQQLTYLRDEKRLEGVRKAIIHINNEAGVKKWTEADLGQLGIVTSAKVLKKDGAVTSPDLGWGMAVFKNLQPGDAILIEGAVQQDMPTDIPGELLDLMFVSWQSPVVHASLELLLPADQPIFTACNRLDNTHTQRDTGTFKLLRWDWRHIPAMKDETAAPDNLDDAAWIMLGSVPDWKKVVQWYQRKTYCRTEPNYEVLEKARALIRPGMPPATIVETLHNFITREISYSYVPFLNNNYTPKKPGATLAGKVGDCKDVATLMITLLNEYNIPAWYTLVSTHSFSTQTEPLPTVYVFNHAIVAYQLPDGVLRFDDLTTDYFPNGILPESDCDAWALVIRDGETDLRRLPNHQLDPAMSRIDLHVQAALDAAGNLNLDTDIRLHGTAAGSWREHLQRANTEERQKKLSQFLGGGVLTHLDLEAPTLLDLDSIHLPLRVQLNLQAYHQLDEVANLLILPAPLPLSTPTHKALFAHQRHNTLDLDELFTLTPVTETVELTLPDSLQLAEMPRDRHFESRFGTYSLRFERLPQGLRIHRAAAFKQRFIAPGDFQEFKQFYLDMLDGDHVFLALRRGTRDEGRETGDGRR